MPLGEIGERISPARSQFRTLIERTWPLLSGMLATTLLQWTQIAVVSHANGTRHVADFALVSQILFLFDSLASGYFLLLQARPQELYDVNSEKRVARSFGAILVILACASTLLMGYWIHSALRFDYLMAGVVVGGIMLFTLWGMPFGVALLNQNGGRFFAISAIVSQAISAVVGVGLTLGAQPNGGSGFVGPLLGSLVASGIVLFARKWRVDRLAQRPTRIDTFWAFKTEWKGTARQTLLAGADRVALSLGWMSLFAYCSKIDPSLSERMAYLARGSLPLTYLSISLGISIVGLMSKVPAEGRPAFARSAAGASYLLYLIGLFPYLAIAAAVTTMMNHVPTQIEVMLYAGYICLEGGCNLFSRSLIGMGRSTSALAATSAQTMVASGGLFLLLAMDWTSPEAAPLVFFWTAVKAFHFAGLLLFLFFGQRSSVGKVLSKTQTIAEVKDEPHDTSLEATVDHNTRAACSSSPNELREGV